MADVPVGRFGDLPRSATARFFRQADGLTSLGQWERDKLELGTKVAREFRADRELADDWPPADDGALLRELSRVLEIVDPAPLDVVCEFTQQPARRAAPDVRCQSCGFFGHEADGVPSGGASA